MKNTEQNIQLTVSNSSRNYSRIAQAIEFINRNFKSQPSLDDIAREVGVSPKKFLQYISIEYAKTVLRDGQASLFDAAYETGLSGTGRLHDLFVNILGMTPGEFKNGGEPLSINYSYADTPFGIVIVATTPKGVCHMKFADDVQGALRDLRAEFPNADIAEAEDEIQKQALSIFKADWTQPKQIKLHLKGTAFQLRVWQALLQIPMGELTTYGRIAEQIEMKPAARAVGTAIGKNPIAVVIPCHRVIRASGEIGGYMWGVTRKQALIGFESVKTFKEQ